MTTSATPPQQTGSGDNPLNEFSGCHEGIIDNFNRLRRLLDLVQDAPDSGEIRTIAAKLLRFFEDVVLVHHAEEEQELFTAVMDATSSEEEASEARGQIKRLVAEHRELEAMWSRIEPAIKQLSKGKAGAIDIDTAARLAEKYLAHAQFEEEVFLPLSAKMLSKNDLSALGLSLHMRHQQASTGFYI